MNPHTFSRLPGSALAVIHVALASLTVLLVVCSAPARADAAADMTEVAEVAAGAQLYLRGLRGDGSALTARRATLDSTLSGAAVACVTCHRHSAMGMQEGRLLVPPIAGSLLFSPGQSSLPQRAGRATMPRAGAPVAAAERAASAAAPPAQTHVETQGLPTGGVSVTRREPLRHQARPAYDLSALAQALRAGVDPAGRALDALMPRYQLSDAEVAQLAAYLGRIDPQRAPGRLGDGLHLATVITPDAPPARAAVVEQTLQRWAASVRLRGLPVHLQVWRLQGASSTWRTQLDARLAQEPVYALLSGAGRAEWEPVQGFCEARQLPCLLPLLDRIPAPAGADTATSALAAEAEAPFYSLYFSAGVDAEAQIVARHLQSLRTPSADLALAATAVKVAAPAMTRAGAVAPTLRLLQLHAVHDELGQAAAQRFARAWGELPGLHSDVLERWLAAGGPASSAADPASVLLLWLAPQQVQALVQAYPQGLPGVRRVLLSAQLTPPAELDLPPAWQAQVAWASMHSDPTRLHAARAMVVTHWLQGLGLAAQPGSEQAEVYAATFFFGDALARMRLGWSPAWLMEQLEGAVNNRPAGASYFSLSLGPGQRVAAKSGAMLVVSPSQGAGVADDAAALPWFERLVPLGELLRSED
jgi:cytochrome c553